MPPGQHVLPHKLPRHKAVLVGSLLVLPLDDDGVVAGSLYRNLVRGELLHVDVHLELVGVELDLGRGPLRHHVGGAAAYGRGPEAALPVPPAGRAGSVEGVEPPWRE